MRIGIFGGSFNPPHKMHLKIAKELINKDYVDKIIFVPTGSEYQYKNNLLKDNYRLDMIKLMIKNNPNMEVSNFELKDYVVYTCETLEHFKLLYPSDEIYFICGTDNLSYIDKWKNGMDILNNYKILVIKRKGDNIKELLKKYQEYKDNIIITSIPLYNLSSTIIRDKLKNNLNVDDVMDKNVLKYIKLNKLYEKDN